MEKSNKKENDLNEIIDKLEKTNSKSDASFGIFQYGGGPDESYIKGNKQGLELFAAELLKASKDAEDIVSDKEKEIIPLEYEEGWIDGDIFIQYIQPSLEKREGLDEPSNKTSWKDKLLGLGCLVMLFSFLGFALVGVGVISVLVFNLIFGK